MKKELSTTASVSVLVPIRDILRRYATTAAALATAAVAACGLGGCSGDGIGTAITAEKRNGRGPGPSVTYGGQTYNSVMIGGKAWMAKNLNYKPSYGSDTGWCYKNSVDSCNKYGRLYTWAAAKTVCPTGWHLPSRAEWKTLENHVGSSVAGKKLKSAEGWEYYGESYVGTNDYGFSALPGGFRSSDDYYYSAGYRGYWWAATEYDGSYAYIRNMCYDYDYVNEDNYNKSYGFSVRCVGD